MLFFAATATAQDINKIYLGDISGMMSSSVDIPVYVENTSQSITAVQFDIKTPEGVTLTNNSSKNIVDLNRCNDHKIQVRALSASVYGANRYRVIMLSPTNKTIKRNKGKLFSINATISSTAPMKEGTSYPIELFDVIISDSLGNNVITEYSGSSLYIGDNPDFIIKNVKISGNSTISPNNTISLSWQVNNIGGENATGGFYEQVSLISQTTNENLTLGIIRHNDVKLVSGDSLSVSAEFSIPRIVGLDGDFKVQVKLTPNNDSGERAEYQTNNTTLSDDIYKMEKVLYLSIPAKDITETDNQQTYNCYLERSGSRNEAMTFRINKKNGDSRISTSLSEIVINKNNSSNNFKLSVNGNDILDGDCEYIIEIEAANGYESVESVGLLIDDEQPLFTITPSQEVVNEGDTFKLTITVSDTLNKDLKVNLSNDHASRFKMPTSLIIPAGESNATIDITAYNDDEVSPEISDVKFIAAADKFENGVCFISLYDDDMPQLTLSLTPTMVNEAIGAQAISGIIKRDAAHSNSKITINITTSNENALYSHTNKIVLNKGVLEAQFSMGTVDNALKEGDQEIEVTAAVYISSCNCSALGVSAGVVTETITLLDDDGAALIIRAKNNNILEGSENNIFTVTRNDEPVNNLVVNITNTGNGIIAPSTVTIPAGQTSADFAVSMERNDTQGDSETITFIASAEGFSKGTCWVMSTDQTLPDAYISQVKVESDSVYATYSVPIQATIFNNGYDILPAKTPVELYLNGRRLTTALYTENDLQPGEKTDVRGEIVLSDIAGTFNFYATINNGRYVKEINYGNNTSPKNNITVLPLLKVKSIETDKSLYTNKEKIHITGIAEGRGSNNSEIEVYIINGGSRFTINTHTDNNGKFTAEWETIGTLAGHFAIGACMPGEDLRNEMTGIDIYGMRRATTTFLTHEMEVGETIERYIDITNHGTQPLTSITVNAKNMPDNITCNFDTIAELPVGKTKRLIYSLQGVKCSENNKEWQTFEAEIISAEGAVLQQTIYYVIYAATPQLLADVNSIKTTMTKGKTREYPIVIRNEGREETGEIYIDLGKQSYLSLATPSKIASLKQFEQATIVLQMTPTSDMEVMSIAKGSIYIGCANGSGQSISYRLETVSEETGSLVVDVWDEFTYNTEEAPHVQGATVTLLHPVTNALMHQAISDSVGLASFENIPEGIYTMTVTHPKHSSYNGTVLVSPGISSKQRVFIEYNAISITMTYEPTEILDEYNIVTTVVYETNVPKPVIKVDNPEKLILSELQMPYVFNVYMTNVGLVTALDATITLPDCNNGYTFTPLITGPFDILPQQTITIPVQITEKKEVVEVDSGRQILPRSPLDYYCAQELMSQWFDNCKAMLNGTYTVENAMAKRMQIREACQSFNDPLAIGFKSNSPSKPTAATGQKGKNEQAGKGEDGSILQGGLTGAGCDPFLTDYGPCGKDFLEGASNGSGLMSMAIGGAIGCGMGAGFSSAKNKPVIRTYNTLNSNKDCISVIPNAKNYGSSIIIHPIGWEDSLKNARKKELVRIQKFLEKFNSELGYFEEGVLPLSFENEFEIEFDEEEFAASPSWWKAFVYKYVIGLYGAYHNFLYSQEVIGNYEWDGDDAMKELSTIVNTVLSLKENNEEINTEKLIAYKPQWASYEFFETIVNRIAEEKVDLSLLEQCELRVALAEMQAQRMGYASINEMMTKEAATALELLNSDRNSVCSKVKLQIDQRLTMTRQAVRGTLTVINGSSNTAMKDIKLNLVVTDPDGNVASSRIMEIHTENKTGFIGEESYESGWELPAGETGEAKIIFIPTKYAAPTEPLQYTFNGSISFVDPFTGMEMTRELVPERLTVNPSPNLELTYFMSRDIFGDDPLTQEVEAIVPTQFSLLINNKGYGDATNVQMITKQPQIVDNEKGLIIDFDILSSQLNGGDKTLAMGTSIATNFGDIPALSQAYAQWWLTSSFTGHFIDYDVQATHVSSYDNPDLSLLDTVTIHELIHQIRIPLIDTIPPLIGFMANDIEDTYDYPDILYLSNGTTAPIYEAARSSVVKNSDNEYILTISSGAAGWNYGNLPDPTGGTRKLVSIIRMSDGVQIPLDNFWQTDRTLRDMLEPIYENLLHYVDKMSLSGDSYKLLFEERPQKVLNVKSFSGVPTNNSYTREKIDTIEVLFNKTIKDETFTTEDITMMYQGEVIDASSIEIIKAAEQRYKLVIGTLTQLDGYYSITVQTAKIVDAEGFNGENGSMTAWIQIEDGRANLIMKVEPEGAGSILPGNSKQIFDGEVQLSATPTEGYTFVEWVCDNEAFSDNPECTFTMMGQKTVTAVFTPKSYNLTIKYNENYGAVEGCGTGVFNYNTNILLKAVPNNGYYFIGWQHGDSIISENPELQLTIKENDIYEAVFAPIEYTSVMLDENSYDNTSVFADTHGKYYQIKMNRILIAGKWNTLCVPFNISEQQINKLWGYSTSLAELKSVTNKTMFFEKTFSIKAGVPYLIKPERNVTVPQLTYINNIVVEPNPLPSIHGNYQYSGVYSPYTWNINNTYADEYNFNTSSETLEQANSSSLPLKGLRAYFVVPKGDNVKISINGVLTDISEIIDDMFTDSVRIYNMQGIYLGNDIKNLSRGVYIINGKKCYVK